MVSYKSDVRRKHLVRRSTLLSVILLLSLATTLIYTIAQPVAVQAQSGGDLWNEPVNLSTSGSASMIVSAGEPNGQAHVMWWDRFDGAKYSFLNTAGTWSKPVNVAGIYGQRTRGAGGRIDLTPPLELSLMADGDGQAFAFWRNSANDLMFARSDTRNPRWPNGSRLLVTPFIWKVYIAADNSLNLVYIRTIATGNILPGVYFRRSTNGASWSQEVAVTTSLYFRTLPAVNANLSVVADGNGQVLVGWDDPQTLQSYQARSTTNGSRYEAPELVEAGGIAEVAIPRRIRYVSQPNADLIRQWEAGDSCVLYQQSLSPDNTWTAPVRVLEKVNGCLRSTYTYPASDGRLFMTIGPSATTRAIITAWDGLTWAEPLTPRTAFIDPSTDNLVALDCENLLLTKDTVVMVGCDQQGDIWALTSQITIPEFLPVASSEWGRPFTLSRGNTDVGLPNVAVDQQNRFHVVWSQSTLLGTSGDTLVYIRGDGNIWTDPAVIVRGAGAIESPNLIADPNQILHLVWSGGPTGQVIYNQAFARDALIASDWGDAQGLPTVRPIGASPRITLSPSGKLYSVYSIPYNEDRGLYFTSSSDLGVSWTPVTQIFDAAAANWGVIHQAHVAVDRNDHLHVVWSRAASPDQESPQGIYYSHSLDGGLTWSEAREISTDTDSEPRLALSSDNILHLVWAHKTLNGHELLHQWSPDGGQTWSTIARIPDLGVVVAGTGLVADTNGSLYLVGMELTRETSSAIFYLRWDGQIWTDRDNIRLGYDFREEMSVTGAILPSGKMGVFYRVWAPVASGNAHYIVGYVGRQLQTNTNFVPVATFTPRPPPTSRPAATAEPTSTPIPPFDLNTQNTNSGNTVWIEISIVVAVMIVISAIAILRLSGRVGR